MSDLILKSPTFWAELSAGVFLCMFLLVLWTIYSPSKKKYLEEESLLPLHDEKEN